MKKIEPICYGDSIFFLSFARSGLLSYYVFLLIKSLYAIQLRRVAINHVPNRTAEQ